MTKAMHVRFHFTFMENNRNTSYSFRTKFTDLWCSLKAEVSQSRSQGLALLFLFNEKNKYQMLSE